MGKKPRLLGVLCVFVGVLLCATACTWAAEVGPEDTLDIDSDYTGPLFVYGTVNLKDGGYVTGGLYAFDGSTVKVTGGTVDPLISVSTGATVTVVGAGFEVTNATITTDPSGDYFTIINIYNPAVLTGTYGGGGEINLTFYSELGVPIYLQPTATALIQELINLVEEMNLQQGIDNSLDAKLDAALNALDDVNENNDVAALNTLQAFISAVEAQRGNKITSEQADALIAKAQLIIALLQA